MNVVGRVGESWESSGDVVTISTLASGWPLMDHCSLKTLQDGLSQPPRKSSVMADKPGPIESYLGFGEYGAIPVFNMFI